MSSTYRKFIAQGYTGKAAQVARSFTAGADRLRFASTSIDETSMAKHSNNSIEVSEQGGVRYLHFSVEWIQGAMRIARPNALELAYTREMMAGLLLREAPWPREALLIDL